LLHARTDAPAAEPAASAGGTEAVDRVREALRQVIDPELGYNIVDLGLVYEVAVGAGGLATVIMTTTTPGCPAPSRPAWHSAEPTPQRPGVSTRSCIG
jgi:hypothetical protein